MHCANYVKRLSTPTIRIMFLLTISFALLPLTTLHAEIINGQVVSISDGDTLTLAEASRQNQTIRLLAIDAPELTQDFGSRAKTTLSSIVFNQQITADCRTMDQRLHKLCVVYIGGKDIGLEQIRTGMAWWNKEHNAQQSAKERADYEQAEFMAKIHRSGLWNSKNPMPPWDWRHGRPDE